MNFLTQIQQFLEDSYGAKTGLDVLEFVKPAADLKDLGKLLVEQIPGSDDLNIALLLDRDIFQSFSAHQSAPPTSCSGQPEHRWLSVSFEEVSHFVYLSFNHNRGRNITALELELQSEIDRILLAYHSGLAPNAHNKRALLDELLHAPLGSGHYETARAQAAAFVRNLTDLVAGDDPQAWTEDEFRKLRRFFHSDLSEKLHLCRKP